MQSPAPPRRRPCHGASNGSYVDSFSSSLTDDSPPFSARHGTAILTTFPPDRKLSARRKVLKTQKRPPPRREDVPETGHWQRVDGRRRDPLDQSDLRRRCSPSVSSLPRLVFQCQQVVVAVGGWVFTRRTCRESLAIVVGRRVGGRARRARTTRSGCESVHTPHPRETNDSRRGRTVPEMIHPSVRATFFASPARITDNTSDRSIISRTRHRAVGNAGTHP